MTRCGWALRPGRADSPRTCTSRASATTAMGIRKTLEDLQALGIENVFALTGDWPRPRPGGPPPEPPGLRRGLGPPGRFDGRAPAEPVGPFTLRSPSRPSSTSRADWRVAVPEAREEDRRGRRLRDHAGRLGRGEGPRAQAVPGRARPPDAGARQCVRPRPPCRRADGPRRAARVLGVADAARSGAAGDAGKGRWAPGPARAGRAHGGGAARARLRRRLPRRNPRRGPRRVDHPARAGAGAALGGAGPESFHYGLDGGLLPLRTADGPDGRRAFPRAVRASRSPSPG